MSKLIAGWLKENTKFSLSLKIFLLVFIGFGTYSNVVAQYAGEADSQKIDSTHTFKVTFLIENDIEIVFEIFDIVTSSNNYNTYYHYGVIFNITSRSLKRENYSLTFNTNTGSSLGNGFIYGGAYTVSNTIPNLYNITAHNNGSQVNYPNQNKLNANPSIWAENVTIYDIGLINMKLDYWGKYGGSITTTIHSTLPIELKSFGLIQNNNQVDISWVTASERDNDYFTIERTVDGINFEIIGTVKGTGNSSVEKSYTFTDYKPIEGISYYRLKQADFNGKFEVFNPKSIDFKSLQASEIVVYPNPTTDGNVVLSLSKEIKNATILIYSLNGNLEKTIEVIDNPSNLIPIFLPENGNIFVVKIISDKGVPSSIKVFKI